MPLIRTLFALVAASAGSGAALAQLTVRVTDPGERPVRSSISFLVGDNWILGGVTDDRGVYRRRERCDGSTPIRAEPLDRSFYPSPPQLCANQLRITVHPRSQPIRVSYNYFDSNADGQLDRIEWINFVSGTSSIDLPSVPYFQTVSLSLRSPSGEDVVALARQSGRYSVGQSFYEVILGRHGGRNARLMLPSKELAETFLANSGTVQPVYAHDLAFNYIAGVQISGALRGSLPIDAKVVRALNETSLSFTGLDANRDGYLSAAELGRVQPSPN